MQLKRLKMLGGKTSHPTLNNLAKCLNLLKVLTIAKIII